LSAPAAGPETPLSPLSLLRRQRQERWWLWMVLLGLLAVVVGLRWQARQQTLEDDADRLAAQLRAVEQNLVRELYAVRSVLLALQRELPTWPEATRSQAATAHMRTVSDGMAGALKLQWMDSGGRVLASNLVDVQGQSLGEREYFQRMRRAPKPGELVVSQPFLSVTGVYSMNLAVALVDAQGRFAGALAATLDPSYLVNLLGSVRYADDMRALLVHGDGRVLVAEPVGEYPLGMDLSASTTLFSRHRASGRLVSVLSGQAVVDGQWRQGAIRTLQPAALHMDRPMVLVASRQMAVLLAGWRHMNWLLAAVGLVMAGAAHAGLLVVQRRRRERVQALAREQAQQQEASERLSLALQGGDLALWDLHLPSGRCTVNDRWYTMLGMAPGAMVRPVVSPAAEVLLADPATSPTDDWSLLLHPEDRDAAMAAQADHLAGLTPAYEASYRLRHQQGHWVWILDRGRVVERDAQGRALRMVGTHMDVSERHRAEAERQLLERHLREAQKMESIGTLAGGIAHDFNNILAAILGNLAMARADLAAEHPAQPLLQQIQQAGHRARSLVQQILTFSRQQHSEPRPVLLQPVLQETVSLLRATLPAGVRLDLRLEAEPLGVLGDATQLQQVLMNLGTNAWHALPQAGGHIEMGLASVARPPTDLPAWAELAASPEVVAGWAHLWVRDDGCGMDAATRLRIFDPFFTTKPVGQGTGLGLSVVHGIVRGHGGVLSVQTAPGAGSCFSVYLPLSAEAGQVCAVPPPALGEGRGRAVLVVDDDEVMVLMVTRLLERAGWVATGSLSAADALAQLHSGLRCDVVVTDYNMPEASGLELTTQLRRQWPTLPVVLSSGYLSDELRHQAQRLGVRALLHKENTLEELPGLLARLLSAAPDAVAVAGAVPGAPHGS
jgi:signal transduction histidine kinase/ActR/RegA family two-component response regulator